MQSPFLPSTALCAAGWVLGGVSNGQPVACKRPSCSWVTWLCCCWLTNVCCLLQSHILPCTLVVCIFPPRLAVSLMNNNSVKTTTNPPSPLESSPAPCHLAFAILVSVPCVSVCQTCDVVVGEVSSRVSVKALTSHTTTRLALIAGATYAGTCHIRPTRCRQDTQMMGCLQAPLLAGCNPSMGSRPACLSPITGRFPHSRAVHVCTWGNRVTHLGCCRP
jgi:hypothetical protein